ncbi:MAG: non-homologous end-joining DNA ligase [Cyanobacteria bacterium]|nr:non-homologous end-joining DNA ligase [Cyanobacteriota bacterium]
MPRKSKKDQNTSSESISPSQDSGTGGDTAGRAEDLDFENQAGQSSNDDAGDNTASGVTSVISLSIETKIEICSLNVLSGIERKRKADIPGKVRPMLAASGESPFSKDGWVFEPKLDGIRAIIFNDGGRLRISSRQGNNITSQYPDLIDPLQNQAAQSYILDGEIIALDKSGRPNFQLLAQRLHLNKKDDILRASKRIPVYFFVFDVLYLDGYSLVEAPYSQRRAVLESFVTQYPNLKVIPYFTTDGDLAYKAAITNGFEGVVGKNLRSTYELGRRSPSWVKVKAQRENDFVVAGYSLGQGSRSDHFGALVLGYYDGDILHYCGKVGSGFDSKLLDSLLEVLKKYSHPTCPLKKAPPREGKEFRWLRPELVVQVRFMEWTEDRSLRFPVFMRLRTDKKAEEVTQESVFGLKNASGTPVVSNTVSRKKVSDEPESAKPDSDKSDSGKPLTQELVINKPAGSKNKPLLETVSKPPPAPKFSRPEESLEQSVFFKQISSGAMEIEVFIGKERVRLTNLSREIWPETERSPAVTKADFVRYLVINAPLILPHVVGRPLSARRAPHGVHKKNFFQKHWRKPWGNSPIPEFMDFVEIMDKKNDDYIVCNSLASLAWLGQNGVTEAHIASSQITDPHSGIEREPGPDSTPLNPLDFPDYLIFDLDIHSDDEEPDSDFGRVTESLNRTKEIAFLMRDSLKSLQISPFVKLSGRAGIHIFLPIVRNLEHDITRELARTIVNFVHQQSADRTTTSPIEAKKSGKVLIDLSPNGKGKTIICPYSARIWQYPTVSWPLTWEELEYASPIDYQVHNAFRMPADCPWQSLYSSRYDLKTMLSG